jgi:hypothetical protein
MKPSGRSTGLRISPLIAGLIICIVAGAVQGGAQKADFPEALRQRVTAYFEAWVHNDYRTASGFIHPDMREYYIFQVPKSAIQNYSVSEATCNPGKNICDVFSYIGRPVAIPGVKAGEPVSLPLTMRWVLASDGQWYMEISVQDKNALDVAKSTDQPAVVRPFPAVSVVPAGKPSLDRIQADPANPVSFHRGEKPVLKFTYRNPEKVPIRLTAVSADCDCVSMRRDYELLGPGETGTLDLALNTFSLPLGAVRQSVRLTFSDLADPLTIDLRLTNLPNFTIAPQVLDFGAVKLKSAAEKTVEIVNESGKKVRLLMLSKTDHRFSAVLDRTEIDAGERAKLTVRLNPVETGEMFDIVTVHTDLPAEPMLNVAVRGRIIS